MKTTRERFSRGIRIAALLLAAVLGMGCTACRSGGDNSAADSAAETSGYTDGTGGTTAGTDSTEATAGTSVSADRSAPTDETTAGAGGSPVTSEAGSQTTAATKGTSGKTSATKGTTAKTRTPDKTAVTADNMLLCPHGIGGVSKSILKESVGYYDTDGELVDFMFDSFAFTLTSDSFYDYEPGNPLKNMDKADWAPYMEAELNSVANLDALLTEAKAELKRPDYMAGVALVILPVNTQVQDWGTIDGKTMNLTKTADCERVLRWQIEEKIRTFKARKFRNVELVGFYVINEDVHTAALRQFTVYSNRVIHDNGLKAYWAPFHDETNKPWLEWRQLGFDECALQANYFSRNCNNCWKIERLDTTVRYVKQYGVGVEPEMLEETYNAATFFKRYLKKYAENGVMESFKAWYVTGSPRGVSWLAKNRDPYVRSAYDEMYRFIKKTLDPQTVKIDPKVSEIPEGL